MVIKMKKILISLLTILLCFTLIGCDEKENQSETGGNEQNQEQNQNNQENNANLSEEEQILAKVGLTFKDIEPIEEYYRYKYDEDDDEFIFYMEKGTERNIGRYANQLYENAKEASKNQKLYKAGFNFYMNDGTAEEYLYKTADEINADISYNYIDQFGYYYNNLSVAITFAAVSDMDGERDDDVYYPIYTVSIGW